MECLPRAKYLGDDTSGLAPAANYKTANGMGITIGQGTGGLAIELFQVTYAFNSSAEPAVSFEFQSPVDFVQNLYNHYYRPNIDQTGPPLSQVYSPSLFQITKNNVDNDGGPIFGGDPFIDSQEADVKTVKVVPIKESEDKATVIANLINGTDYKKIEFNLVKIDGMWKIDDIDSLRRVFKLAHRRP